MCCISSRFSSFHMLMFFGLFSCTGPAVQCASGDLCIGVRGCGFLNHMTSSWHMSVCGPTLVAVCVCVSLFLTLPFLCVFQEKVDTSFNSSQLCSDIQVSRPTILCISVFRHLHTCSHHHNSLLQHTLFHNAFMINQHTASSDYTDLCVISD